MINIILASIQLSLAEIPKFCTSKSLEKQSKAEKRLSRNAVYAQYGRTFSSKDLQQHFYGGASPKYRENSSYSDKLLSSQDLECIERIKLWEQGAPAWSGMLDLNGDGIKEKAYLFDFRPEFYEKNMEDVVEDCDGQSTCLVTLLMEDEIFTLPMKRKRNTYFGKIMMSVVNIDKADATEELMLQYHAGMYGEDPPKTSIFFYSQNGRTQQTTISAEGYNAGEITLKGDGLIQKSEIEWINNDNSCITNHLAIFYDIKGTETSRKITKTEPMCAACPYVEAWNEERQEWEDRGEILRYINSKEKKDWNTLTLQYTGDQLRIRLSERKAEITYLDALQLRTSNGTVLPESCSIDQRKMIDEACWCQEDDESLVLVQGDIKEFVFQLPNTEKPRRVVLEGLGYYEPLE